MTAPETFIIPNVPVTPPRLPLTLDERREEATRLFGEYGEYVQHYIPAALEMEIVNGVTYPHPSLDDAYESGCAEPWTSQLVANLLVASNRRNVLETGCFTGQTSAWLACALERVGGGTLTTVDIDPERTAKASERLQGLGLTRVTHRAVTQDVLQFLPTLPNKSIGFAWIDDNHEKSHVDLEIRLLWDKMEKGGIMCFHDCWGSCDLQSVVAKYGGYSLDIPRLGAAGGVGFLQIR